MPPVGQRRKTIQVNPDDNYKKGDSHGIPFRCLIPENISNLLVAGRCISVERIVLSSTRVMPNCLATGEAAGIAATLAIKENTDVCNISGEQVMEIIKSN
ncbi:MAG: FAD-dependent oxidoreductase [Oscillospiraceae bacterium]